MVTWLSAARPSSTCRPRASRPALPIRAPRRPVIGLSGGLDSTLALLVTVRAFDALGLPRTGITAVSMPGFGTTHRTKSNAESLARDLGVSFREVSIHAAVEQHFKDIEHDPAVQDVTYENSQGAARPYAGF